MSAARYLDLLRAENEKICPYPELTKLTKPPLVSLVSSPPRHFQRKKPTEADPVTLVLGWLASIGETDPQTIEEVLRNCEADPECLDYYLMRAAECREAA